MASLGYGRRMRHMRTEINDFFDTSKIDDETPQIPAMAPATGATILPMLPTNDDIDFLKSGATLYVSLGINYFHSLLTKKGEDFDQNSCFSEYEIIKTLGEGGFGKVVLGIHKLTKEKFAIKIVNSGLIGFFLQLNWNTTN